jgi:hypothetical protein
MTGDRPVGASTIRLDGQVAVVTGAARPRA